jgi:hypothetical protein
VIIHSGKAKSLCDIVVIVSPGLIIYILLSLHFSKIPTCAKKEWCFALLVLGLCSQVSCSQEYDVMKNLFIVGAGPMKECAKYTYTFKRPRNMPDCVGKEMVYSKAAVACESTICSQVGR